MRLINPYKLKENLFIKFGNQLPNGLLETIDNEPTVEPTFGVFKSICCDGCDKRQHGKWELCEDRYFSKCSLCGDIWLNEEMINFNFCPKCGADMREGNTDE